MLSRELTRASLVACLTCLICIGFSSQAFAKEYIITTGGAGGTYHPMGMGAASLWSMKLGKKDGITVKAVTSSGSVANVERLNTKKAHLAIVLGLVAKNAVRGEGTYKGKPVKSFRAITMLWPDVEHFVLRKDKVKTGTIADIKGKKFSTGPSNSGTEAAAMAILKALGITEKEFNGRSLSYYDAARAMSEERIDGASMPAGPPVASVTALYSTGVPITILSVTKKQLKAIIDSGYPGYPFTLRRRTYPGQKKNIKTIAQPNLLLCRTDLPEKDVYLLTKTLFTNLKFMKQMHKMGKYISLKNALEGLPVQLHPGAYKFYKEKRRKVPAAIMP